MRILRRLFVVGLSGLFAFSAIACSDDATGGSSKDDPVIDPDDPVIDPEDPGSDPEDPGDDPTDDPSESGWGALLLPAMATDVELANDGYTRIKVMLVSTKGDDAGEGMVGKKVYWGVETGSESVSLDVTSSSTKDGGVAQAIVRSRQVMGQATVVASSKFAPKPVTFNVDVLDIPTGSLSVEAIYKGSAPVDHYAIRLYDAEEVSCWNFDYNNGVNADPIADPVDQGFADFKNLTVGRRYSALAYGYGANGVPLAVGCIDSGMNIVENGMTSVTVYLDTVDLDIAKTYHVRSYFDLGDVANALGDVGRFVTQVADFADNPAEVVYDLLINIIKESASGIVASGINTALKVTGLKQKLVDWINNGIASNSGVCKVGLFACQLRSIIRTMEFMGELKIMKSGNVELMGTNAYDGLSVYWRIGCATDAKGNYKDPNCGRMPLTTKQLKLGTAINFLEGTWSGALANGYDKMSIEAHELKLEYGKIAVYLINNVLLPKLAGGAKNFTDAIAYWINCKSISTNFTNWWNDCSLCPGHADVSEISGYCKSASGGVASLLGFASAFAQLQKAGSDITISGTAMIADTNADNVADDIQNGRWSGSMTITNVDTKEQSSTAVRGIWSAYNMNNVKAGETDAIYCTNPKTSTDSADQLCSYPAIDAGSLISSNMCSKFIQCSK